jgi:hypothetical protein
VVCSTIKAFRGGEFNDWNVYSAAKYWARCIQVHTRQVSSQARLYTVVRYEDFVTRPEITLKSICSFLGLTFGEEMLNAHRVAPDYIRPGRSGKMPELHALTEKPLDATRTDAWKSKLSASQSRLIEQVAGKQMMAVGYAPERKEYSPPKLIRVTRFSPRWTFSESRRITANQIRTPYWALRRILDVGRNAFKAPGIAP